MTYEGMTWNDLVRRYFPDADDKACDYILWEKTAFPIADIETIEKHLQDYQVNVFAERRSNFNRD